MHDSIFLPDAAATEAAGRSLAGPLRAWHAAGSRTCIHLQGPLAAGKTTLARGLLRGLGITAAVRSPTYTLVERYRAGELDIFHIDLYRLVDAAELEHMGARDVFGEAAVLVIEWPERAAGRLPQAELALRLVFEAQGRRLSVHGACGGGRGLAVEWRRAGFDR